MSGHKADPFEGGLFLFVGKRFDALKILWWERNGFVLWWIKGDVTTARYGLVIAPLIS